RTITLGISQIALIFLVSFASRMSEGSVSVFNFSMNLQTVPLSIIGVSYSIAAFPTLSRLFSSGQKDKFLEQIITSSRHIIFWSIPISALFIILRAQIVRTILGAGKFSWEDTRLTAASLALFTISIIAQSLLLLFIRGYYAMGNTKKPLYAGLFSGALIVLFSYGLIKIFNGFPMLQYFIESLLRVGGIPGTVALMLPLGYSLALTVNCAILALNLHKDFPGYIKAISATLFQSFSASIIMGFVSYLCLNILDKVFNINKLWGIFSQGLISGLVGLLVFILILKLLKNRELNEIWKTLHKKIWKAQPIAPDVPNL
ncbi:MAG: oligosaccharide flippase family protein, partial [Patescibacteria group bacterium]|nr:oligosaccharide flippase family protein [Patescibacteria group bacterium]